MSSSVKLELSREMSLFQVTMMGVGMMIGAGVFVATGIGIGIAGPGGMLLAFALNGLLAFLSVMTYAELGSALPKAGGGYSYVQDCYGGFAGFITGWISWFGHAAAGSLYAITFSKYTLHFLIELEILSTPLLNLALYEKLVAVFLVLIFIMINYRGASETGRAGIIIAIGQTVVLLLIGIGSLVVGLFHPDKMSNFTPFITNGWGKVFVVMGFCLIGFEGYEVISHTAEEVIDAKKNVPKGIFYAVIIVVTTYLFVTFAAIIGGGLSNGSLKEWFRIRGATGFADAISRLFPFGGVLALLAAVFASTSALNATIFSSTRISFTLGRDGHLPTIFEHISKKTRIPDIALLLSGTITIIVTLLFEVETVMAGASLFFIFLFNIVTFSGMKIRIERGHELQYGYLIPFFPVVPVISILGRTLIGIFLLDMALSAYVIAGIWLFFGFFYYLIRPKQKHKSQNIQEKLNPDYTEDEIHGKQILVAVSNSETAPLLLKYGETFAVNQNIGLTLTSIVQVPYQTPISEASRFTESGKELLDNLSASATSGITVNKYQRYAHNTAEGIIQSVRSSNANLLVLGWRGNKPGKNYRMGSTLDPVIEKAACDLIVIKKGEKESSNKVSKILCLTKGKGSHGKLVWDIVRQLASAFNSEITIMHVTASDKKGIIPEQLKKTIPAEYKGISYNIIILQSNNPTKTIQNESVNYDLVVIGASESSVFQRILFGSRARKIAENCSSPVIMVRKNTGIRSWFKRWFV